MSRPRTIFFGSPEFAVPALARVAADTDLLAVVTQPDRPAGRGQGLAEPAVKRAARAHDPALPILQPEKIRTPEFEATLRAFAADLFIVVAYGRILPQGLLDLPARGPINVHASLLPRLRGAAPIQWSSINGDSEAGVSIMRMEAGLDTGPVCAQASMPIQDDDTGESLARRLAVLGAELLAAQLPRLASGEATFTPQDDARAGCVKSRRPSSLRRIGASVARASSWGVKVASPDARRGSCAASSSAPRTARRRASDSPVSPSWIGIDACAHTGPVSSPASMRMIETPASLSPLMIDHWMGAAPRPS